MDGYPYQDASGAPTAVAPKWAAVLGGRYEMPFGNNLLFAISADARYSGKYLASGFNNPLSRNSSYWNIDAGLRVGSEDQRWEVAVIGKNLTNELYINGVVDGPSTGTPGGTPTSLLADQTGFAAMPRTIAVQLTTRF